MSERPMSIDRLLPESEKLLLQLNAERLKQAEDVMCAIVEKARTESERLRLESPRAKGELASSVVIELLDRYLKIAPFPSPDDLPDLRQSCDEILKAGSRFLLEAEGRELSGTARSNIERLRKRLAGLKRIIEDWDTEIAPRVVTLDALFEQFRGTEVVKEGLRLLKLLRDTEVRRKQKRATERQRRRN